jgi:hypothetical protein
VRAAQQPELPLPRTTYAGTYEGVGDTHEGDTEPSYEFDVEEPEDRDESSARRSASRTLRPERVTAR